LPNLLAKKCQYLTQISRKTQKIIEITEKSTQKLLTETPSNMTANETNEADAIRFIRFIRR